MGPAHRRGLAAAAGAALLAFAGLGIAQARELSREETLWARDCVRRLDDRSPLARGSAEVALIQLGIDALPFLVEEGSRLREVRAQEGLVRALRGIGMEAVLRGLQGMAEEARGGAATRIETLRELLERPPPPPAPMPLEPQELTGPERRWVRDVLDRLGANSPRVRAGAEAALVRFGLDALPVIVDERKAVEGRVEAAAIRRVFAGMDAEAVAARLASMEPDLRGAEAETVQTWRADLGGGAGGGDGEALATTARLRPSLETAWEKIPFDVERELDDRIPAPLGIRNHAVEIDGDTVRIDTDGDGSVDETVQATEPRVVTLGTEAAPRPILVYRKLGRWYAASARVLVAVEGSQPVTLLDADLDGSFTGPQDRFRWGDGAYRRHDVSLLPTATGLARYLLEHDEDGWRLRLTGRLAGGGADGDQQRGLRTINAFRNASGLAPQEFDPERSRACTLHARYLALNRGPATEGAAAHSESPDRPGYTAEGLAAAQNSTVGGGDLTAAARMMFRTMLHRTHYLSSPHERAGLGMTRQGGVWSVLWTGMAAAQGVGIAVPAPGQTGVPRRGHGEWPPPDDHPDIYKRPCGYPVSVSFQPLRRTEVSLQLLEEDGRTPVPGFFFSPEAPIARSHSTNAGTAFYLPRDPLRPGARYWALFAAKDERGTLIRRAWMFTAAE